MTIHDIDVCPDLTSVTLDLVKMHANQDDSFQILKQYINRGWLEKKEQCAESTQCYFSFRSELSITNRLILKGIRVMIPKTLRPKALESLHQSHMGIVKSKERAKT